ncbi:beta-glucoside-specific PTS transporter subunit IIABC [Lactiplantibacillus daowaiensis]|uniref:Beta-glucoside-specific PTS transporter subunit IIABC n=1 Tax=Lactiplantibacillus daowaiensis TaxID=2559918 RepID=A0ABW1S4H3_9LACO|nr:beta-glucoside-specific PTS transporter subunit IIABC [Lactiplantibacillus daowaiensis]
MAYEQLADEIIKGIGGKDNVISVVHCTTRLRFKLKDEHQAKTDWLKALDGVVTVVKSGGQYQVVIGNQVADVYDTLIRRANLPDGGIVPDDTPNVAENTGKKLSLLDKFIDLISSIFTPTLGLLASTGMIKGFTSMFRSLGWLAQTDGTFIILNAIGDAFFYFLPILLGYSAAKKFKLDPFIGMAIGAVLVYPAIVGLAPANIAAGTKPLMTLFAGTFLESQVYTKFFGIPVLMMNYTSSVIPVILSVWVASKLKVIIDRVIPAVVKTFLSPLCTLLIVVPLTLLIIGPLVSWMSEGVSAGVIWLYKLAPILAGLILGGLWQVLVMFGLHWGLIPVAMLNLSTIGKDPILALITGASFAQTGVVLAIILHTKNVKLKVLGTSAFISGIFGVTEPAIYGVTLPRKKTFIFSCIGGGIAGGLLGLFGSQQYIMGGMGIFKFPALISPKGMSWGFYGALIASAVAFAVGFLLTMFLAKRHDIDPEPVAVMASDTNTTPVSTPAPSPTTTVATEQLRAPIAGTALPLTAVQDEVFSSESMGQGAAIEPSDNKVVAPADATISLVFPTKHAIGLHTDLGADILIHIGMDTVQLEGEYFTAAVKQGDHVSAGQLLMTFDATAIKNEGYVLTTPIIITNTTDYNQVQALTTGVVTTDNTLLTLTK